MTKAKFALAALLALLLLPAMTGGSMAQASPDPAPPSGERRVLSDVHTDAISSYLDDGRYVLATKADVDGDIGKRLDPASILFAINDQLMVQNPASTMPQYAFLKDYPKTFWLAPQTQKYGSLWPGFSTEHDALSKALGDGKVSLELTDVKGPGQVEIFTVGGVQSVNRMFSSRDKLPAWTMNPRQHTHANWAFAKAGCYVLTFKGTATLNGKQQTAEQRYTFVVGNTAVQPAKTKTSISAPHRLVTVGQPLAVQAIVQPADAAGAVEFFDAQTGQVYGHSKVRQGKAGMEITDLPAGLYLMGARFVPSWVDEFSRSEVAGLDSLLVQVAGEVTKKPTQPDTKAPQPSGAKGGVKLVSTVKPGATTALEVPSQAGKWVSVWIGAPGHYTWQGWVQASTKGRLTVSIPHGSGVGHVLVKNAQGETIGWDDYKLPDRQQSPSPGPSKPAPSPHHPGKPGTPSTPAPVHPPKASTRPGKVCHPDVVLDHGHVDMFNVSVAGGKAVLQLKEDVTGSHVLREPETVVLKVKPSALRNVPGGVPGSPRGYVLPLSQDAGLLWPGWDSNSTAASGYGDVTIDIQSVTGPGRIHLYSFGSFGGVTPVLAGGATRLPARIHLPSPAHVHAQWVFTHKGIYTLKARATARHSSGQTLTTATHTYVFQVGDVPLGDALCKVSVNPNAKRDAAAVSKALTTEKLKKAAEEPAKKKSTPSASPGAIKDVVNAKESEEQQRSQMAAANGYRGIDPMLLGGLIGGGSVLFLGGLGLVTVGYVRKMRRICG